MLDPVGDVFKNSKSFVVAVMNKTRLEATNKILKVVR